MKINIEYIQEKQLIVPEWRATYTLRPELMTISASLIEFGFIQPIHVRKSSMEIIDGSERVMLALNIEQIYDHTNGLIPAVIHDVDQFDAMMLHLRLNRGRSNLVAMKTSQIIRKLYRSGKFSISDYKSLLSMGNEELSLMLDGDLFKTRKLKEHNYARAWVPIEAPSGSVENSAITIESPPNPDR